MEKYPDIEALYLFFRVVEAGSFSEVSHQLKIPKATLSRKISLLEDGIGAQLLVRTTRVVRPTEIGRIYFQRAMTILAAVEDAQLDGTVHTREDALALAARLLAEG